MLINAARKTRSKDIENQIIQLAYLLSKGQINHETNCEYVSSCLHGTDLFHYRCGIDTE